MIGLRCRRATLADAPAIVALIEGFWLEHRMLRRSLDDVAQSIATFTVAQTEPGGVLVGCGALFIYNPELAEIRSLGVSREYQGKGLGKRLTASLMDHAAALGVTRVFALTLEKEFFESCGFDRVEKNLLPEKIWRDCIGCASFPNCNETAYVKGVSAKPAEDKDAQAASTTG